MSQLAIDDLRRIMIEAAGTDSADALAGDFAERTFDDLGFDSLALIETLARIGIQARTRIPDVDINEYKTPQQVLDLVNGFLLAAAEAS